MLLAPYDFLPGQAADTPLELIGGRTVAAGPDSNSGLVAISYKFT